MNCKHCEEPILPEGVMKDRQVPTTLHSLVQIAALALSERADYIREHADSIPVRIELGPGNWTNVYLAELARRNPKVAFGEAFRLLLRTEVPYRRVTDMERSDET